MNERIVLPCLIFLLLIGISLLAGCGTLSLTGRSLRGSMNFEATPIASSTPLDTIGVAVRPVATMPCAELSGTNTPMPSPSPTATPTPTSPWYNGRFCVNTPIVDRMWQWQVSAPRSVPVPVRPGEIIRIGLRNKFGQTSERYQVLARVTAPNGITTTATTVLEGDKWVYLLYPTSFKMASSVYPGVYTVVWEIGGKFIACDGFVVKSETTPVATPTRPRPGFIDCGCAVEKG